ncbi:ABC transporter permease [Streptomyces sp. NBC_00878]|uniref:ABC transporter permease n=1 Tax=Streptomyces sp. NBC_00878 TaxID=2975854 RepID=UPI00225968FA|nr:ABC transporter permease [Streptomyces sp. NBC_00878]MCX4904385.1 ABC transporter permease [Streptomyces sp. NBC_00878]
MSHAGPTAATSTQPSTLSVVLNNRLSYLSFGFAWLIGHGVNAMTHGDDPVLDLPSAVPAALLVVGLVAAVAVTSVVTARALRGVQGPQALVGNLLAASWPIGFGALFLVITALSEALDEQEVHTLMWPTASGLVVGLLYLAGGAAYHDRLQYTLGSWLALTSSAALFLDGANLYWALALAGGGSYFVAAALEPRRRADALLAGSRRTGTA